MPLDTSAAAGYISKTDCDRRFLMCNPIQSAAPAAKLPVLLYYITDRRQFAGSRAEQAQRLLDKIRECAAAGVDYIQLREKDLSTRELERLGTRAIAAIPSGCATRLLINSRIDVALACGAHGVHLPANHLSAGETRAIFARAGKTHPIIGVSAHSAAEVLSAESQGADFAVLGPVFEKKGIPNPNGLQQLAALAHIPNRAAPAMPILALGGITLENAAQCLAAGAAGIAVIRMFQEKDVATTVETLRRLRIGDAVASG
jgi:thiamine-phosphate pyrophosphorylase